MTDPIRSRPISTRHPKFCWPWDAIGMPFGAVDRQRPVMVLSELGQPIGQIVEDRHGFVGFVPCAALHQNEFLRESLATRQAIEARQRRAMQ